MSIPKLRTIRQSYQEIKKLDSDSTVTEYFIRSLCKSGKVQHFMSGNKILVNFDDLIRYLNSDDTT